jgi:signal transduction histidine kinase
MTKRDGLSSDHIFSSFQDREGNVWVGTARGLDRFSELVATPIAVDQADPMTVLAAHDGSVWMGTLNGLNRWHGSDLTTYRRNRGLPGDSIGSLVEDDRGRVWASTDRGIARFENGRFRRVRGVPARWVNAITADGRTGVWISDQDRGLLHVVDDAVVQQIPWSQAGGDGSVAGVLLADRARGGLWLGFFRGGVAYLKDGQIEASYQASDGLGRGSVMGLHLEADGAVWAATENGLSRIADRRVVTLTRKNGLPCDTVHWLVDDKRASYWLYTACGLVQIPRLALQRWMSDPTRTIEATVFDASDGVRSRALMTGLAPRVSQSSDGRFWFVNVEGVSVVDPIDLPINTMPPTVRIEQITANQKTLDASAQIHLPGSIRDLEIEYTALSLVAPEKNRFRIKLEGYDRDWQDVGSRRQAFYTNLPPRQYRFRVAAANNSGVWNDAGAALDFTIAPAYYQTMWFRAVGFAGVCALLWALHQLRLRQIASQFDTRLQARLKERTRIARELHDTLLQSLHGLMFRFQAVRNMLPRRTDEAMEVLDGAISRTEQAIAESRDAIQDLRSESLRHKTVGEMLAAFGQELASTQEASDESPFFRVTVEGKAHPLSANFQDEIARIARELLRNAFQHAHAHRIEAEIRYDDQLLCLRVRDDGTGIDPPVLRKGQRAGHWGLRGVRERAQRIGAQLDIWSEATVGTEVQLRVPAAVAYDMSRRRRPLRLFRAGRTHEPHP